LLHSAGSTPPGRARGTDTLGAGRGTFPAIAEVREPGGVLACMDGLRPYAAEEM